MSIREINTDGKITYDVSISVSSKIKRKLRVQMLKRGISTLKEATQIEKDLIRKTAAELAAREGSGVLWKDLIEKWELENRKISIVDERVQKSTIWETSAVINRFTKSWMDRVSNQITAGDVKKVLREMESQGYSRGRMKALRSAINVVYRWAIEEGEIIGLQRSPAVGVQLAGGTEEKPQAILSIQEIHHLLDCAKQINHEWYPVWAMALNTGMRSGELYALEWADVDFENKLITVSKSYNKRMDQTKSTKAGYWRKVPINPELEELLLTLRSTELGATKHVLPRINIWRRGEAAKVLKEFCVGIGISEVHFHALRACFATHMLNAGASSPVVKKICGWTDEKVMTRYIRLAGIDVSGATENLGFMTGGRNMGQVVNMHGYRPIRKKQEN